MRNVPISLAGYTLAELVIVVATLALIAAIAAPSFDTDSEKQLELVAEEFAAAMRFARSESMRTGLPHGFRLESNNRLRAFSVDTSDTNWTWLFDVYHPVTKQVYDYRFPTELEATSTPVTSTPEFRGSCDSPDAIYFDAAGTPWCLDPHTVLVEAYRLDLGGIRDELSVTLDGITGRVTVR